MAIVFKITSKLETKKCAFLPLWMKQKKNIDLQAEIHFFLSSNWSTVETFKAQAMFIHKFYTTENYSICLFIGVFHEIYNYYYSIIQLSLCVCSALTEKRKKKTVTFRLQSRRMPRILPLLFHRSVRSAETHFVGDFLLIIIIYFFLSIRNGKT